MNHPTNTTSITDYHFKDFYNSRFARISYAEEPKIIVCELKSEYVPIEHFKDTFYRISELVKSGINQKFVFDKRSLRAFHQPSMEWYFLTWKKEMLGHGLRVHRKVLPNEAWFKKSVMIARDQIAHNHPDNVLDQLDIQYCDSLEEALQH